MTKQAIQDFARQRSIPYLVHFTRTANLASIIMNGIYPVSRIGEIGVKPVINDEWRLDGHLGGISVSIGHPNYRMFFKLRKDNPDVDWVVLCIKPSVLWTKDCAFCRHNAADARISSQPIGELKTTAAFAGIYEEVEGLTTRADQRLKSHDPTDAQAEILVFDAIEPNLIVGAAFETAAVLEPFKGILGDRQVIVPGTGRGPFSSRNFVR